MKRRLTGAMTYALGSVVCAALACCAYGQENGAQTSPASELSCSACHVEESPTKESADLIPCMREKSENNHRDPDAEAPDFFVLDALSEIYVPVIFPHKLHAAMTDMAGGCAVCHHRNPPGDILGCAECHGGPSNPVNLSQPSLKGAYHRQCLGCHREWSHETDCVVCHAKRAPGVVVAAPETMDDIIGTLHPNVVVPKQHVYEIADFEDGEFVTFHHKDHTEIFGLKCVACHQQENCSRCHDVGVKMEHVRDDPHQDCTLCHQELVDDDCMFCHDTSVRPSLFEDESEGEDSAEPISESQAARTTLLDVSAAAQGRNEREN